MHARAVIDREGVEERRRELERRLAPNRVGDVELKGLPVRSGLPHGPRREREVEGVERRMQRRRRKGKVEGLGHFAGRGVRRAGVRHRERDGDAVRRVDEVRGVVAFDQVLVEVERELGVAGDERGGVRRRTVGAMSRCRLDRTTLESSPPPGAPGSELPQAGANATKETEASTKAELVRPNAARG